jgi:hypothetical protein
LETAGPPGGLVRVKVRVVVPPSVMAADEKLFESVGIAPANAGAGAPATTAKARERAVRRKGFVFMRKV